jgi:copper(I)-binding protein
MLMDLPAQLEVGSRFDVTLTFDRAGEKTVEAEVRAS